MAMSDRLSDLDGFPDPLVLPPRPTTVVISGGFPAPEVPNCIGLAGAGCLQNWRLVPDPDAPTGWWRDPEIQSQMAAHEETHRDPRALRVEIRRPKDAVSAIRVWRGGVLIFDGVDRTALLRRDGW